MIATQLTREEAIQNQYKIYLQKRAEKQAEEQAEQQAKAKRLQEIQSKLAPSTVKVIKPHKCAGCSSIIQKGNKATVESIITGFGWPEGNHYRTAYYCGKCRPVQEA